MKKPPSQSEIVYWGHITNWDDPVAEEIARQAYGVFRHGMRFGTKQERDCHFRVIEYKLDWWFKGNTPLRPAEVYYNDTYRVTGQSRIISGFYLRRPTLIAISMSKQYPRFTFSGMGNFVRVTTGTRPSVPNDSDLGNWRNRAESNCEPSDPQQDIAELLNTLWHRLTAEQQALHARTELDPVEPKQREAPAPPKPRRGKR